MKIYNTITRTKEEFKTIEKNKVKMYVCGPTVYDFFHIGNARPFLIFDAFRRFLEYKGYEVTYIQNFTDVDDKIINRGIKENISARKVAEKYMAAYFEDAKKLGIKNATVHPTVTDNIPEIIKMIEVLIDKGYAYNVDGDVYFETKKFKGYAKLSNQNIEELEAGARVEINTVKKNPTDFALWKKKKQGEISWDSPFSEGRPGWHIECSAMIKRYLGSTIDIHAGGRDLIFPHHENEVAQSEAYTGKTLSNYWMHNGYINIDNKKMSKSAGNFFTVRDILKDFDPEVVRFFILSVHYRNPVNFSRELIESAAAGLDRIYTSRDNIIHLLKSVKGTIKKDEKELLSRYTLHKEKFIGSLDDDFNTADGISSIFELVKDINVNTNESSSKEILEIGLLLLNELTDVLGLIKKVDNKIDIEIEELIKERQQSRKDKNYKRSDEIRDILNEKGIVLEDTPSGIKWSYKK